MAKPYFNKKWWTIRTYQYRNVPYMCLFIKCTRILITNTTMKISETIIHTTNISAYHKCVNNPLWSTVKNPRLCQRLLSLILAIWSYTKRWGNRCACETVVLTLTTMKYFIIFNKTSLRGPRMRNLMLLWCIVVSSFEAGVQMHVRWSLIYAMYNINQKGISIIGYLNIISNTFESAYF